MLRMNRRNSSPREGEVGWGDVLAIPGFGIVESTPPSRGGEYHHAHLTVALLFFIIFCFPVSLHAEPKVGEPAPALAGDMLDGKPFDLAAMKGHVVIVHFWATWCAPCQQEMPVLDAFYRKHHGQGLDMIAVSADRARDSDKVADVMKSFVFPAAMLGDLSANGFGRPTEIPVTYVVDGSGVVRTAVMPSSTTLTEQYLIKITSSYLGAGPP